MLQSNNGILLKVSKSKSRKRVIQAKNIQFRQDHQTTSKFQSLSPESNNQEGTSTKEQSEQNVNETLGVMLKNRKVKLKTDINTEGNQNAQQTINIQKLNKKIDLNKDQITNRATSQAELQSQKSSLINENFRQISQDRSSQDNDANQMQDNIKEIKLNRDTQISHNNRQSFVQFQNSVHSYQQPSQKITVIEQKQKQQSPEKSSHSQVRLKMTDPMRNDHTPTTAASSNKRDNVQTAELIDLQSGQPLQSRKKVERRIDVALESRGSIFTGRDEQQILYQKRQNEQKEIQEALRQQIEDKKKRLQEEKVKQDQFENQWNSPKVDKRRQLDSQSDSLFSGMNSPMSGTGTKFSFVNQFQEHSQLNQPNIVIGKYNSYRNGVLKDILEEEKSVETTTLQGMSPTFVRNQQSTPSDNQENNQQRLKSINKIEVGKFDLKKSGSHSNLIQITNQQQQNRESTKKIKLSKNSSTSSVVQGAQGIIKQRASRAGVLSPTQQDTQDTENSQAKVIPKLQQAHVESQNQIDALSSMVEQLLVEQKNLKNKINLQERLLEGHLGSKEDEDQSAQTTQRNSSREFKIRKSTSKGSIMMNQKKSSKDNHMRPDDSLEKDNDQIELIQRNLILNHQINLKNLNPEHPPIIQSQQELLANQNNQNQRYNNRQSNKMQFLERNEKLKQKNHLIKFGPSNQGAKQKVQSLEPIRESLDKTNTQQSQIVDENILTNSILEQRFNVAKSIDALQTNNQLNQRQLLQGSVQGMKPHYSSQENLKFSNSVKHTPNSNLRQPDNGLIGGNSNNQNLDFAGQSQLLFFSENVKSSGSNFLPEIRKNNVPQAQENVRNPSNSMERFDSANFRNMQQSNFKMYTNIEPSSKKATKQQKRNEDMEMISSIMMPDSIVLEQNQMRPVQNNLINSQKFVSSSGGDTQNNFFRQPSNSIPPHQYLSIENHEDSELKQTQISNVSIKSKKSQGSNKLSLKETAIFGMKKSGQKFYKTNPQQNQINLADRLTFSNFNKDSNFEPILIEQSQQAFYQNVAAPPSMQKRQSPSPSSQNTQTNQFRISANAPMMIIKKSSSNQRLAPIALIQKKITPIKKKFPHDFFGGSGPISRGNYDDHE